MKGFEDGEATPVCVITAAWNQVDKTLACVEAILAQDYRSISVLLVNNGSTDNTIHMNGLKPEHFIDTIPGNGLRFN